MKDIVTTAKAPSLLDELQALRLQAHAIAHQHATQIKRTEKDGYPMSNSIAGAIESIEEAIFILDWSERQEEEMAKPVDFSVAVAICFPNRLK